MHRKKLDHEYWRGWRDAAKLLREEAQSHRVNSSTLGAAWWLERIAQDMGQKATEGMKAVPVDPDL